MGTTLIKAYAKARTGSVESYLPVVERYQSLVFGFIRMSGVQSVTAAMTRTQQLFLDLWKDLASFPKLADYERELVRRLIELTPDLVRVCDDARLQSFLSLPARDRLVAVTIEVENWSVAEAAHAFGMSRFAMERDLLRIRCDWIGVHFISLTEEQKKVLRELSTHLCRDLPKKHKKRMADAATKCGELREFKARCLEKRCEVIELWLDLRLLPEERVWMSEGILNLLEKAKMHRPAHAAFMPHWFSSVRRTRQFTA